MAVNSIFSYDNVLPGVITEIDSKLSSDYDTTLFGTTDSIVVIGGDGSFQGAMRLCEMGIRYIQLSTLLISSGRTTNLTYEKKLH